jgi:nitroreductase
MVQIRGLNALSSTQRKTGETLIMSDYKDFQMPLADAITTQRAIRRIKPDPLDDALVLKLIELALKGPTAQNQQQWEFIIVKDPEIKRRLGRQNRMMWKMYRPFANWSARRDPKAQKLNTATEWGVDHFEEIPVYVVACFRGSRFAFPPVVAASTYGSISRLFRTCSSPPGRLGSAPTSTPCRSGATLQRAAFSVSPLGSHPV